MHVKVMGYGSSYSVREREREKKTNFAIYSVLKDMNAVLE